YHIRLEGRLSKRSIQGHSKSTLPARDAGNFLHADVLHLDHRLDEPVELLSHVRRKIDTVCMGADGTGIVIARFGIEDLAIGSPTPIPAAGGGREVDPAHASRRRRPEGNRDRRETQAEEFLYLEIGHVCVPPTDGRIAQTGLLDSNLPEALGVQRA